MTVVVACTSENWCGMSFDSASSDDDMVLAASTPKAIIHAGNGIMGAAGSWRIINLLSKLKARKVSPETIVSMLKEVKGEDESIKEMVSKIANRLDTPASTASSATAVSDTNS